MGARESMLNCRKRGIVIIRLIGVDFQREKSTIFLNRFLEESSQPQFDVCW